MITVLKIKSFNGDNFSLFFGGNFFDIIYHSSFDE